MNYSSLLALGISDTINDFLTLTVANRPDDRQTKDCHYDANWDKQNQIENYKGPETWFSQS